MITKIPNKKFVRKIKIRRGIESQRILVLFEEGEPIYTRDTKRVYVGDNKNSGGVIQTHKSFITNSDVIPPIQSTDFDILYNQNSKKAYIIHEGELVNAFDSSLSIIERLQKDINNLNTIMFRLSTEVCNPDLMLKTDSDDNVLTDNKNRIKVTEY